jgi:hypothetical protein
MAQIARGWEPIMFHMVTMVYRYNSPEGDAMKGRKQPKITLAPLSLEDALRGAMKVDPKKVKGPKPKKKK